MQDEFMLGINYWPARKAMYWWKEWDAGQVEDDFARISESGIDKVRFFLLWEDFQPEPFKMSSQALRNLAKTLDIAYKYRLGTMPTFFTGHMSGLNWMPEWMLGAETEKSRFMVYSKGRTTQREIKNFFENMDAARAQAYHLTEIAKVLQGQPALWGWDLGNEPSNCVIPESKEAALHWLESMVGALKKIDEAIPVTIGMHMEDLEEDRNIGSSEAAKYCDFICMHGYPIYTRWADGPTDNKLLPFLASITGWLGKKPVLFQEFGLPTLRTQDSGLRTKHMMLVSEQEAAEYYSEVLKGLYNIGCIGAFAWCYSDYDPQIWNLPPLNTVVHERYFGLWKHDGHKKEALRSIGSFRKSNVKPMNYSPPWIDIRPEDFYTDPLGNLKKLYRKSKNYNELAVQ